MDEIKQATRKQFREELQYLLTAFLNRHSNDEIDTTKPGVDKFEVWVATHYGLKLK